MTKTWTKTYPTAEAAARAVTHYEWIRDAGQLPLPDLLRRDDRRLVLVHVHGRHVAPSDLPSVARALAHFHTAAHQHLGGAPAGKPHQAHRGLTIPAFDHQRKQRLLELLTGPTPPDSWLTPTQVQTWTDHAAHLPATVYKDANVRNFLLTGAQTVAVDFDTLTLAPPGYDLAKLVVSATMTHGPLPSTLIDDTRASYNTVLHAAHLPGCTAQEFTAWTEIHHILTTPYQGRNGYRYSWASARSCS
jgi:aminoglycoside phosphotransferase (APT) family kinase protein